MARKKRFEEIIDSKFELESFTNAEWYYIISDLLCLGGLGSGLIEKEKLFISFPSRSMGEVSELKFFFTSTLPVISNKMTGPEITLVLGRIARGFDEIIYHCVGGIPTGVDNDTDEFDAKEIANILSKAAIPEMRPLNLFNGLVKILNQTNIESRGINQLFLLDENSPLESGIRHRLNFGMLQDINYSDDYYLIVRPSKANELHINEVIDFTIKDNEDEGFLPYYIQHKVDLHFRPITETDVTNFENGACYLLPPLNNHS